MNAMVCLADYYVAKLVNLNLQRGDMAARAIFIWARRTHHFELHSLTHVQNQISSLATEAYLRGEPPLTLPANLATLGATINSINCSSSEGEDAIYTTLSRMAPSSLPKDGHLGDNKLLRCWFGVDDVLEGTNSMCT